MDGADQSGGPPSRMEDLFKRDARPGWPKPERLAKNRLSGVADEYRDNH